MPSEERPPVEDTARSYPDPPDSLRPCARPMTCTPGDVDALIDRLTVLVKTVANPKAQTDILLAQRLLRHMRKTYVTKCSISI
jgi:hypothetical protein